MSRCDRQRRVPPRQRLIGSDHLDLRTKHAPSVRPLQPRSSLRQSNRPVRALLTATVRRFEILMQTKRQPSVASTASNESGRQVGHARRPASCDRHDVVGRSVTMFVGELVRRGSRRRQRVDAGRRRWSSGHVCDGSDSQAVRRRRSYREIGSRRARAGRRPLAKTTCACRAVAVRRRAMSRRYSRSSQLCPPRADFVAAERPCSSRQSESTLRAQRGDSSVDKALRDAVRREARCRGTS